MNQILDFGVGGGNDNNNYNYNKKPEKQKKEKKEKKVEYNNYSANYSAAKEKAPMSDRVVKVFAVLMVILAIALIASGATSLIKNKGDEEKQAQANKQNTPVVEATIDAELNEITGKVTITVDSPITIDKMVYSWDQDHDYVVSGEKQTSLQEQVVAPSGEHTLHIQVTDEQNNKTMQDFIFDSATGIDTAQPKITLVVTEDKKLKVTATDDTSIAYVTYTWNQEETVTMTPENENMQEYEFEIEIPRGKNTIFVTAVDGSESGNAKTATQTIDGVTKPEITYGFLDNTGAVLKIMCSHENGIKKIYYTLNGQPYQWEVAEGEEAPTYLEFTQESVPGTNSMTITVTSVDDTEAEFNPQWEYVAPVEAATNTEDSAVTPTGTDTNTTTEGNTTNN